MGKIKATATNEHGSAYAYLTVSSPKILSVARVNAAKKKKMNKAKYGVKACLQMDTQDSCRNCSLLVAIHCDDWKDDYIKMLEITTKSDETTRPEEQTFFEFTPNVEWLKDSNKSSGNMVAKIYLVSCWMVSSRPPDAELARMAEAFEQNKTEYQCLMFLHGNYLKQDTKETEKIPVSKIVIVIDPGHGHKSGKTGSVAWKYSHAIKNEKGDIKKNDTDEVVTQTSTFRTIPDYVYSNREACTKWQTKLLYRDNACETWNEREIVFEIAELMKSQLEKTGYVVYMTRAEKIIASGSDDIGDLYSRNSFSNEKNADYFISIHVNGNPADSSIWKRGAFHMYRENDEQETINRSKQLGISLVKYLKTYNKDETDFIPIITDTIQQKDLAVLSSDKTKGNKAKYKSLVEIGTYTNPKDAAILFDNKDIMKITVAEQLVKGLFEHITDHFLS